MTNETLEGATSGAGESWSGYARRINEIVDIAERMAKEIRADAEREANAYLEARRREADGMFAGRVHAVAELEASLLACSERARDALGRVVVELDEMIASIRSTRGTVDLTGGAEAGGELRQAATGDPVDGGTGLRPVGTSPAAAVDPRTSSGDAAAPGSGERAEEPHADAILRATQLAVAGRGRNEIEATLREELGITDPAAVLDGVLGTA